MNSIFERVLKEGKVLFRISSRSIVRVDDCDYHVWPDGGIDIYVSDFSGTKYYPRSEQRHISIDRFSSRNPKLIGIVILSEQIRAICELLKYTDKRFARDYYLNNLDDSIKRYKDGENCFIGKESLSLIDSLLRNPHLEYDEAIHLMRLASDMRFIRKNSMVSDSPIPIFTSNMDSKTLIDGMIQVHYEELRTLLLNEIEKKLLS